MKKIKDILMNKISDQDLATLVRECNAWDGSFEHLNTFDTWCDLDMFAEGNNAHWLACRIHFGDFNPNDEYFNFDAYGNLQSFSKYDYNEMINDEKEEIIDRALELRDQGDISIDYLIEEYTNDTK